MKPRRQPRIRRVYVGFKCDACGTRKRGGWLAGQMFQLSRRPFRSVGADGRRRLHRGYGQREACSLACLRTLLERMRDPSKFTVRVYMRPTAMRAQLERFARQVRKESVKR